LAVSFLNEPPLTDPFVRLFGWKSVWNESAFFSRLPPMDFIWLPWQTPERMLAWEEAFLEEGELFGLERLWVWEAAEPFVVVGYGQQISREVNEAACLAAGVRVRRRCSGGGAVVQGPGCLSYGLVLKQDRDPELLSITGTNAWIMGRLKRSVQRLVSGTVQVQGHTDLTLDNRKFSGNAQRRKRNCLLFHGTFLYQYRLDTLTACLPFPSSTPKYRVGRSHPDFVCNLPVTQLELIRVLKEEWQASDTERALPDTRMHDLLSLRYSRDNWHLRIKTQPHPTEIGVER